MRKFLTVLIISLLAVSALVAEPVIYSFNPDATCDNAFALVKEASTLVEGVDYEPVVRYILDCGGYFNEDEIDALIALGQMGLNVIQNFSPETSPLLYDLVCSIASAVLIDEGDIPASLAFLDSGEVVVSDFNGDWDSSGYLTVGDLLFIDGEFIGYLNDDYTELRVMGVLVYSLI